jgi:hypothetical protein
MRLDGTKRQIMSIKESQSAQKSVHVISGGPFDYVEQCEGLTFALQPELEDPITKAKTSYAFKLTEERFRLLLAIKCDVSFTNVLYFL